MLKPNPDGYTFDRGIHKLAVQFFGADRETFARQINEIVTGRNTYKHLRSTQPSFYTKHSVNYGFPGSRGIHTVTVTHAGEKVAEFHSMDINDVMYESRAFVRGILDAIASTPPEATPQPISAVQGLQRKVEEQRKEIGRLKSGSAQGKEIARLTTELRVSRNSYANLQQSYYTLQKELSEAKQQLHPVHSYNVGAGGHYADPPDPDRGDPRLKALDLQVNSLMVRLANLESRVQWKP